MANRASWKQRINLTVWNGKSFNDARIEALSFKTGKRKVLIDGGTDARYLPDGHLAYAHNGTLFMVGFDAERVEVKPYAFPSLSPDGKRIALTLQSSSYDVWVYDLERDTLTKISFGSDDYRPRWSPDGKMLAVDSSKYGHQQVYVKPSGGKGSEAV